MRRGSNEVPNQRRSGFDGVSFRRPQRFLAVALWANLAFAGPAPANTGQPRASAYPAAKSEPPAALPYRFEPGTVCPFCAITPQFPVGRSGLHWHDHWDSVGTAEYVSISVSAAAILALRFFVPTASEATWDEPILFDGAMRDALRIDSANSRKTASTVSDVLFVLEVLHPTVIDPLFVAWWKRESPLVAWQMFVIDAQAYGFTLLLNDLTKRATARARPWVSTDDCATDFTGPNCGSGGRYQSFYSGHAAVTATGAGLICAHHTQLSLYQNDWLDTGTCALAVAGTAATGALRIASDNHWASDVIVGHLMGYVSGYLLPTLLYYKQFRVTPHEHGEDEPTLALAPLATGGALGLTLFGMF
jgi:membrane-associated phospholipid phosphatase